MVKFKNKGYLVTCAHLYHQQKVGSDEFRDLTLFGESSTIVSFSSPGPSGFVSAFRPLISQEPKEPGPDIAIAPAVHPVTMYIEANGKKWLDLDEWEEPDWEVNNPKIAGGYATEHKDTDGKYVLSSFLEIVADLSSINMQMIEKQFQLVLSMKAHQGAPQNGRSATKKVSLLVAT
ncbi:hypothetical protein [Idiomarina abyssalis]|uniref:hypothetical protein n=1 Tax=Idiomarina abyssalis TaxID=86102 RepID=UPI003A90E736